MTPNTSAFDKNCAPRLLDCTSLNLITSSPSALSGTHSARETDIAGLICEWFTNRSVANASPLWRRNFALDILHE